MKKASTRFSVLVCLVVAGVGAPGAAGQAAPLVVEVRAGAAVPVGSFADGVALGEGTGPGASLGFDLAFSGQGRRTFYVGFSQHRFDCEEAGCPAGSPYVATGFDVGFRLSLVTRGSLIPWVRVGAVTSQIESPGLGESEGGVGGVGYGGEVGVGVYLGTWNSVALNPGVRWARVGGRLPGDRKLDMHYVVADLGLSLAF